jgi:3-oxoacyl-[acyl-carrier protein] reductase
MNLLGKTAIVTGGTRGIGRAIALTLAAQGANIIINYTSNAQKAEEVVQQIKERGGNAIAVKGNVSKYDEVQNMIAVAEKHFSSIDILVNNAGITKDTLLMKMKEEDWDQVIAVNLKGAYNCTKAVIRKMMKQKCGKIINLASVVGITGNVGQANYAASKAGVIGFTKSVAREVATRGINVNAIAPGYIQTDMTDILSDEVKEVIKNQIPMKRLGRPEDVANIVAFLCSEEADYITGQIIHVDGGMVM